MKKVDNYQKIENLLLNGLKTANMDSLEAILDAVTLVRELKTKEECHVYNIMPHVPGIY